MPFFFSAVHSLFCTLLASVNISDHNLGIWFLFCKPQLDVGNASAYFIYVFQLFFHLWKKYGGRGRAEGMFLLNVVYIYDLSLITPLFLPAARCFVSGRALQWFICIRWCGCSIFGVCFVCMRVVWGFGIWDS